MATVSSTTIQRQRLHIRGVVQGVGFRPFVYNRALHYELAGFVLNNSQGVTIEVEGAVGQLASFQQAMRQEAPPLAHVESIEVESLPPRHERGFQIADSQAGQERQALISPDSAICNDCLRELFDAHDRRHNYPFINCTNCGPRFTIIQDVPYDREKTTMRVFPMCPTCQAEYEDPSNRRFHAQPNACPVCGPHVKLRMWNEIYDVQADLVDPITTAATLLSRGSVLAIKGLGGYHLACDACNPDAVQRLRQHKRREAKPFALMVSDLETARELCAVGDAEAALLQSHQRPIVLLTQQPNNVIAQGVAPACDTLGIMLPYTPLHHLLLRQYANVRQPAVLVMTSGNLSDEPIAYRDDDAHTRLVPIADGALTHNREIHMRTDDSVLRIVGGAPQFLRRARGYVPQPLQLGFEFPMPLLACGAHLKNTFCLGKERHAFLSHHIGDLENLETLASFREGIPHFEHLFEIEPQAIAYDLHPDYLATRYALDSNIERKIGVQHHHAHIASVIAEHNLEGAVIGIAADGTGFGTDGAVWGCEIMEATLANFTRHAHLTYVPLPGGERAIRQPWRMAAVYLKQAFGTDFTSLPLPMLRTLDTRKWHTLAQMVEQGINSPPTSSLGRLFDAVAALLNIRQEVLYEGQAAIELEALAHKATPEAMHEPYPFAISDGTPALLDVIPTIQAIVHDLDAGTPCDQVAARFHATIVELMASACVMVRQRTGLARVALSGGVFQNRLLLELMLTRLGEQGFQVYTNRQVPPNDGGLSLGQIAIAAASLREGPCLNAHYFAIKP